MNLSPQRNAHVHARVAAVAALLALLLCARPTPAAAGDALALVIHIHDNYAVVMFDDNSLFAIEIALNCQINPYPEQVISAETLGTGDYRSIFSISDLEERYTCELWSREYAGEVDIDNMPPGRDTVAGVCRDQRLIYKENDDTYLTLNDGTAWDIPVTEQFEASTLPLNSMIVVCGNALIYETTVILAQPATSKPPAPDKTTPPGRTAPRAPGRKWPIMPRDLSTDMITQQEYNRLDQILPAYIATIVNYKPQFASTNIQEAAGTILIIGTMLEVEPRLIVALIAVESGFNSKTAPKTGSRVGLAGVDPKQCRKKWDLDASEDLGNITCAVFQIRMYGEKFIDSKDLVDRMLAAYRYGDVVTPKSRLTRQMDAYINQVVSEYARLFNGPLKGQSMDGS